MHAFEHQFNIKLQLTPHEIGQIFMSKKKAAATTEETTKGHNTKSIKSFRRHLAFGAIRGTLENRLIEKFVDLLICLIVH